MSSRPRIDLDGVPLADPHNTLMPVVLFRHRTTQGLVLQIPESGEVLVPWEHIEAARVDLSAGRLEVTLSDELVKAQNWLRGAKHLVGEWLDRVALEPDLARSPRVSGRASRRSRVGPA